MTNYLLLLKEGFQTYWDMTKELISFMYNTPEGLTLLFTGIGIICLITAIATFVYIIKNRSLNEW